MISAHWMFVLIALLGAGCVPAIVTATFPEVYPPPTIKPNAIKVGLAPVADSRRDESAGWDATGIPVVAGPGLTNYIQQKFRGQMVAEGFAPIDASDPGRSANLSPLKTVLVTLQSSDFGETSTFMPHAIASTDIAVQVFAPGSRTIVFAQSYKGTHHENGRAGPNLAAAADGAIDQAFADKAFLEALR